MDEPRVSLRDYLEARLVPLGQDVDHLNLRIDELDRRLQVMESAVATLQGRLIAFAAAGALFGGTVAEAISHLIGQ